MTIDEVCEFCNKNKIKSFRNISLETKNITKNEDGSFNFNCELILYNCDLEKIPFKINIVNGDFVISDSILNSSQNFPKEVSENFTILDSNINNFEWGTSKVGGKIAIQNLMSNEKYFEDWNFLYDIKFGGILIQKGSFFAKNDRIPKEYKNYTHVKNHYTNCIECSYEDFQKMKDKKIIINTIKEMNEYVMEI